MRSYYQSCCQEQTDVSHKTLQKVLILVSDKWYSNCYMNPELANKYIWWQVGSVSFSLTEYHNPIFVKHWCTSNTGIWYVANFTYAMTYFWIKNINDNAYSTPLLHEDLDMDHKVLMLGFGLYQNTFSYLCVQHQYYHEHDNICLYIFFYWISFYI